MVFPQHPHFSLPADIQPEPEPEPEPEPQSPSSHKRPEDTQSGVGQVGFSCWRQCRCAASSLESIAPHSGQSTVDRCGLALHDVVMCRCWSCRREKVLSQYSHGCRFPRAFFLAPVPPPRRRLPGRRGGLPLDAGVDTGAEGDGDGDEKVGAGADVGVDVGVEAGA
jgi:hypothetical protein